MIIRPLTSLPVAATGSTADPVIEGCKRAALQRKLEAGLDRSQAEAEMVRADRVTWSIGLAESRREFWQAYSEEFATGEAGKVFLELVDGSFNSKAGVGQRYSVEWAGKLAHAIADPDKSTTLSQRRDFFADLAARPVCQYHGDKKSAMELFRQEAARTDPTRAASLVGDFLEGVARPEACERALQDYRSLGLAEPDRRSQYFELMGRGYSGEWISRMLSELEKPLGDSSLAQRQELLQELEKLPSLKQHQSKVDSLELVADRIRDGLEFGAAHQEVLDFLSHSGPLGGRPVDFREHRLHEPERQEAYLKSLKLGMSALYAGQATETVSQPAGSTPSGQQLDALGELVEDHTQALQLHRNKLAALAAMRGRLEHGQSLEAARDQVSDMLSRMPTASSEAIESALSASTAPTPAPVLDRFSQWLEQGLSPQAAARGLSHFSEQGRERIPGTAPAYTDLMRGRSDPEEVEAMASSFERLLGRGVRPEKVAELLARNQEAVVAGHLDSVLAHVEPDRPLNVREGPGFVDFGSVRVRTRTS